MSFRFSAACHISQNLSFYGRFLDMGPRSMVGHFTLLHRIIWSKNFDLFTMVYVLNRQCKYRTIALKLPNTMVHATMLQYYGFSIDILGISQLFCTKLAPFAPQKIQKKPGNGTLSKAGLTKASISWQKARYGAMGQKV